MSYDKRIDLALRAFAFEKRLGVHCGVAGDVNSKVLGSKLPRYSA